MKGLVYRLTPFIAVSLIFVLLTGSPSMVRVSVNTGIKGLDILITYSIVMITLAAAGGMYAFGIKSERQEAREAAIKEMYDRIFG